MNAIETLARLSLFPLLELTTHCIFSVLGGAGEDSVGFGLSGLCEVSSSVLSPLIGFNTGPGASPALSDISVVSGKNEANLYI